MEKALAIIGGSGAYKLLQSGFLEGKWLPPLQTPFGASQPVLKIDVCSRGVLFLSRHGTSRYEIAAPWVNYRANIWALKELGAGSVVSWSGPGAIDESLPIGSFVVPDDIMDETKQRESSFFEGTGLGFVRQNPVFCPALVKEITEALREAGVSFRVGGVYVCTEGPRLETRAEIRKYKLLGGHMVGMTLAPEVFLARELEMCVGAICYITNYAEGIRERAFMEGVLFEGLSDENERNLVEKAVESFPNIVKLLAERLSKKSNIPCSCGKLMERYRRRGDIGPDWHTWIRPQGEK